MPCILRASRGEKRHNLGVGFVKRINDEIGGGPVAVLKSNTQDNSFVVVTDKLDINRNPIIVEGHFNKQGAVGKINQIASGYGKKNFSDFVKREKDAENTIFESKKGLDTLPQIGLQLPKSGDVSDPMVSMAQKTQKSTLGRRWREPI